MTEIHTLNPPQFEWNNARIVELTRHWLEGRSTADIGRILGCGKNAVVGKVHRLGLPSRPSPLKHKSGS